MHKIHHMQESGWDRIINKATHVISKLSLEARNHTKYSAYTPSALLDQTGALRSQSSHT